MTQVVALYGKEDRVRVVDPADRRKRAVGTIVDIREGMGPLLYVVKLDDQDEPMGFYPTEIAGRPR